MSGAKQFFNQQQQQEILAAIQKAESLTSGEIRLHLEDHCKGDPFQRGLALFAKLKMHTTAEKNGVLFYLAVVDHKFAIIADEGIHQKVPEGFWDAIKDGMREQFMQAEFLKGLIDGITAAGQQLGVHFPRQSNDKNELSDEISFGNEN